MKIKRGIGVLLCMLLCAGMLPTSVTAATGEVRYQQTQGGEWTTGSFSEACENVYDGGVIELLSDIKLASTQTISKSITIKSSDENNPYSILSGAADHGYLLNLEDAVILEHVILDGGSQSEISATRALVSVNAGGKTVTISEGVVLQNNINNTENGVGGGLCLISGSVQMNGGVIQNCSAEGGGAVAIVNSNANKFILNNGSITNNIARRNSSGGGEGGGVYIGTGTFEMNGGSISENQGYVGGAIFIDNPYSAYLKISDGNITKNQARYGGGIYSSRSKLIELYGGHITDNVAQIDGGGVYIAPIAQVKLKGSVVVNNNISKENNAYYNFHITGMYGNSSFKADIQIVGPLKDGRIGISTFFDPRSEPESKLYIIKTDGVYSITESDLEAFDSDDDTYHILMSQDQLYLQPHTIKKTDAESPTCSKDGNIEYWYCDGCKKYFKDAACTDEATLAEIVIEKLPNHTAGTEWKSDAENHWNVCECGEIMNKAAHEFKWVTDKEATVTEAGSRHEECIVCGYAKAAVEIPATGADTSEDSAKTGDSSVSMVWLLLLFVSGGAALTLVVKQYKRRG